ncbi:MAG: hypothetical protein IJV07_00165 [Alphaproteobacteria bacterium]|nr:hypothetical protein [Alphaproteobacteria bacterium]
MKQDMELLSFDEYKKIVVKTISRTSKKVFAELKQKQLPCIDAQSWRPLRDGLEVREACYALGNSAEQVRQHTESASEMLIRLTSKAYDPERRLSKEEENKLLSYFNIDLHFFRDAIKRIDFTKKLLTENVPGKTDEDRIKFVNKVSAVMAVELSEILDEMGKDKAVLQNTMVNYQKGKDEETRYLLLNTVFFEVLISRGYDGVCDYLGQYFEKHPDVLTEFADKESQFLSLGLNATIEQSKGWKGLLSKMMHSSKTEESVPASVHIAENSVFASAIRKYVSPRFWSDKVLFALTSNTLNRDTKPDSFRNFALILDTASTEQKGKSSLLMFELINRMLANEDSDKFQSLQLKNFFQVFSLPQTSFLFKKSENFIENLSMPAVQKLFNLADSAFEQQTMIHFLMRQHLDKVSKLTTTDGRNAVWALYDQDMLPPQTMEAVIQDAIGRNDSDFLLSPKKRELTHKLPGYKALCDYFRGQEDALKFISGFQGSKDMDLGTRISLVRDFVGDSPLMIREAQEKGFVPHWAKCGNTDAIVSLFYHGDLSQSEPFVRKVPLSVIEGELMQPDEKGKTAWHHFCEQKSHLFFGRRFRELHASFMQSLDKQDHVGNTPLDYTRDSLKYRLFLTEKIPDLAPIMEKVGLSLTHLSARKIASAAPVQRHHKDRAKTRF